MPAPARYTRPTHTAPHPCPQCHGPIVASSPGIAATRKYCSIRCRSLDKRVSQQRICRGCRKALPFEAFGRFTCGSLKWRCTACEQPRRGAARSGPIKAPEPCLGCHKEFYVDAPPSRAKIRKVCSKACHVAILTKNDMQCNRCHKTLPASSFDYQPCGNRRRQSCQGCWGNMYAKVNNSSFYRPPPSELLRIARKKASCDGLPFELTGADARRLYAAPCALCGGMCGHLHLVNEAKGYVPGNVSPACRPCHKLLKAAPLKDVITHAVRIARHAGESAQSHDQKNTEATAHRPKRVCQAIGL